MPERIPTVKEVMVKRAKSGRTAEQGWNDGWRLVYLPESGSTRGARVAGAMTALQALGLLRVADAQYALSSAFCASVYGASGKGPEGTSIYYRHLNDGRFLNLARALRGDPVFDTNFLVYEVMGKRVPFDPVRVINSPTQLNVFMTDATKPEVLRVSAFSDKADIQSAMHRTTGMPILSKSPIPHNGGYEADGGVLLGGIPIQPALEDGFTHALVIRSVDEARLSPAYLVVEKLIHMMIKRALRNRGFTNLADNFDRMPKQQRVNLKLVRELSDPLLVPQVYELKIPRHGRNVSFFETRAPVLRRIASEGYETVIGEFAEYSLKKDESITIIY
ncbi:hypothetical protein HYS97_00085 [Candidatus Daviesbacteria bacterium]|nr:hypothetical protein [Candidatus Daviesbacteria bacterium]